jgi:hypothetical protein
MSHRKSIFSDDFDCFYKMIIINSSKENREFAEKVSHELALLYAVESFTKPRETIAGIAIALQALVETLMDYNEQKKGVVNYETNIYKMSKM